MRERLEFYLRDARGFAYDVVNAVLAAGSDDIVDAITAGGGLIRLEVGRAKDLEAFVSAFKRIKNILSQAEKRTISIPERPDEALMGRMGSAETKLWLSGAVNLWAQYEVWREDGAYDLAISHTASLRPLLDRFFDEVMVMADDEIFAQIRLALLQKLYRDFSTIADFSEIVTEGK